MEKNNKEKEDWGFFKIVGILLLFTLLFVAAPVIVFIIMPLIAIYHLFLKN